MLACLGMFSGIVLADTTVTYAAEETADRYSDAILAYENKDLKRAAVIFEQYPEEAASSYYLAKIAEEEKDPYLASMYYDRFLTLNNEDPANGDSLLVEDACYRLGLYYEKGNGKWKKDPQKAFTLFTQANLLGSPKAAYRLGIYYENGIGTEVSNMKAISNLEMAAKNGCVEAMYYLGLEYETGQGCVQTADFGNAIVYYLDAVKNGMPEAQNRLGVLYASPDSSFFDPEIAIQYFEMAAENGCEDAKQNLAILTSKTME